MKSWIHMKGSGVLSGITRLIRSNNPKFNFVHAGRRKRPALESARPSGIFQLEFFRNLITMNPLPPYFQLV
jgi:hypothetical protein